VRVIADLGFIALVPIVALVFASAALGDLREDGTLVYLWLRPMDRWPVVAGAWSAAITVSLPLTTAPLVVSALLVGDGDLVAATVLATVVGVVAYSALFLLAGLLVKNSIVWGLAYILIWEGFIAAFGTFAARLAIRGYTRSIITSMTEVDLELGDLPLAAGVLVPVIAAVVLLVLASIRLRSMEVA
jgi:ABC-2 type transport system permease protein